MSFAQNQKYLLGKLHMNQNFSYVHFFLRNLRKIGSIAQNVNFYSKHFIAY